MATPLEPTVPLRLAGAGPVVVRPLARSPEAPPGQPALALTLDARAAEASRLDSFVLSRRAAAPRASMVAASVPGGVDFAGAARPVSPEALPFYQHPADRNAAATAVSAGRVLDVEG